MQIETPAIISRFQSLLETVFEEYLTHQGASLITRINYRMDLRQFFGWLGDALAPEKRITVTTHQELLRTITAEILESYKRDGLLTKTPITTINRRLSAVRAFLKCASAQGWISENPADGLVNIKETSPRQAEPSDVTQTASTQTQTPIDKQLTTGPSQIPVAQLASDDNEPSQQTDPSSTPTPVAKEKSVTALENAQSVVPSEGSFEEKIASPDVVGGMKILEEPAPSPMVAETTTDPDAAKSDTVIVSPFQPVKSDAQESSLKPKEPLYRLLTHPYALVGLVILILLSSTILFSQIAGIRSGAQRDMPSQAALIPQ
ncbi:site-specific integrase, partial [Candidatus Gottesmanbacteria bacterium]|nr:site-specific integrase [Candidatus Gottesmanbacteria bacterium]